MKDGKYKYLAQDMQWYEGSIRDAHCENDVFNDAYNEAMKGEDFESTRIRIATALSMQSVAHEFFVAGWESAVDRLKDDTPPATAPSAEPVANLYVHKKGSNYGIGIRDAAYYLKEGVHALYTQPPADLRNELDAMTAERDKWKAEFAQQREHVMQLSASTLKAIEDRDKWQAAHADTLAELRKVAEELGALKGEPFGLIARDAARYRWLRNPNSKVALVLDKAVRATPSIDGLSPTYDYEYRAGNELDTSIDAAITAQGEKP